MSRVSPGLPRECRGWGLKAEVAPWHEHGGSVEGLNWGPSLRETPGHQGAWEGPWEFQAGRREAGAGAWLRCGEASCPPEDMCLLLLWGCWRVGIRHCRPGLLELVGPQACGCDEGPQDRGPCWPGSWLAPWDGVQHWARCGVPGCLPGTEGWSFGC